MSQQTSERAAARDNPAKKLTTVIVRLPPAMVAEIDQYGDHCLHRSERIRGLLTAGLKSEGACHG